MPEARLVQSDFIVDVSRVVLVILFIFICTGQPSGSEINVSKIVV